MKPIISSRYLILLLIALFAGNAQSQSIRVERIEGQLRVNGEPIDVDALPEELDLGEVEFSLQSSGTFPMQIEINGTRFEIWQDRVTKADQSGLVHFKLYLEPDGTYTTIESGALDVLGLVEMMSEHISGVVSSVPTMEYDLRQMMEVATVAVESRDKTLPQQTLPQQLEGMASRLQEATRMLEFSGYLENVQNASDELYELLQHEWRKEVEVAEMAGRIRVLDDGSERDEAIEQLRAKLEEIFLMKQENRRMEIQHLEMELERMERRLKERSRAMDRLIDARLDELLGSRQ